MSTQPFPVVVISDPAIDIEASDFATFIRERDPSVLQYKEGERPTVFHCRPLTRQEIRDCRNTSTDGDRYEAAFVRGLVRAERLWKRDGSRADWSREVDKNGKQRVVSDRDLEALFTELEIQEVGAVIWHRSSLPFRPGSAAFFQLLDISQLGLTTIKLPRADASTQRESDKPQQEEPQQATLDSSND